MSGYLSNLVSRTFQPQAALQPRIASIFGPASAEPGWTPTAMPEEESGTREVPLQLGREKPGADSTRVQPPLSAENVQATATNIPPMKRVMPSLAGREVSVPSIPVAEALPAPRASHGILREEQNSPVSEEGVATRNERPAREREAPPAGQKPVLARDSSEAKAEPAEKKIPHRAPSPLKDEAPLAGMATRPAQVVDRPILGTVKGASQRLHQAVRHEAEMQTIAGSDVPSPRSISGVEAGKPAMTVTPASRFPHQDAPRVPIEERPSYDAGENHLKRDIETVTLVPIPSLRQIDQRETRAGFHDQRQSEREPVIEVTIGRIEVRAAAAAERRQPGPTPLAAPSLEDYLRRRSGKSRHE